MTITNISTNVPQHFNSRIIEICPKNIIIWIMQKSKIAVEPFVITISPQMTAVAPCMNQNICLSVNQLLLLMTKAVYPISEIFAISEGWKVTPNRFSQRGSPFITTANPGTKSNRSKTTDRTAIPASNA